MARVDDFQQARDLTAAELGREPLMDIVTRSGLTSAGDGGLEVCFLGKLYHLDYPEFQFTVPNEPDAVVPLQEQVLILHYLKGSRPVLADQWIAYREIPGASFYFGPFVKRAVDPLKKVFGENAAGLAAVAAELGAERLDTGNAAFKFVPLPYAPVQIILWEGDEEFPAEANILFDRTIGDYLSPEDAAWLAGFVVYRMMALARR